MDKLKTYAVPIVALVLLLIWVFVVKPMLDEGGADDAAGADGSAQGQDADAKRDADAP